MNKLALLSMLLLTASCANRVIEAPIVDMKYVDPVKYHADLRECQQYAEKINPGNEALAGAALGAALGAGVGAAVGSPYGNTGVIAAYGAGTGMAAGAGGAGFTAANRQKAVLYNCLIGRGYRVLG